MKLKFFVQPSGVMPKYSHETDSGMDVSSIEEQVVPAHGHVKIHTGVHAEIPDGFEIQVRPRSGMAASGIVAAFGTVDQGYRGEICVTLYNHTDKPYWVAIGQRIAQLVLSQVVRPEIERIDAIDERTDRGSCGFGSTGK